MARGKILVVDDEPAVRFGIRDFLEAHGHEARMIHEETQDGTVQGWPGARSETMLARSISM